MSQWPPIRSIFIPPVLGHVAINGLTLATAKQVCSLPIPDETESYVPVEHEALITRVEQRLMSEGVGIQNEHFALSKDKLRMFGLLEVHLMENDPPDYGCVIGLINSYDNSIPTGIYLGAKVFESENLSFQSGATISIPPGRAAILMWDVVEPVSDVISDLAIKFVNLSAKFEKYKQIQIVDAVAHDLMVRLLDKHVWSLSEFEWFLRLWRAPRDKPFATPDKTAWRFFNAGLETVKENLWRLPARTKVLQDILDEHCGGSGFQTNPSPSEDALPPSE